MCTGMLNYVSITCLFMFSMKGHIMCKFCACCMLSERLGYEQIMDIFNLNVLQSNLKTCCVYGCIYVYMCVCVCVFVCVIVYVCVYVYVFVYAYVMLMYMYMCMCMYMCIYIYIYMCMFVCMSLYIYIYIPI